MAKQTFNPSRLMHALAKIAQRGKSFSPATGVSTPPAPSGAVDVEGRVAENLAGMPQDAQAQMFVEAARPTSDLATWARRRGLPVPSRLLLDGEE